MYRNAIQVVLRNVSPK